MGALSLLAKSYNWEKFGDVIPEDAAQAWLLANEETLNYLPCSGGIIMPVGSVFFHAGLTVPDGTLLCDGASLLIDDYPLLYEVIGTVYGGDSTHFNLPDLTEKFPLGAEDDTVVGDTGGSASHTLSVNEIPAHQHGIKATVSQGAVSGSNPRWQSNSFVAVQTEAAGGGQPHNNMPPYIKLLPVIVYQ